MPADIIPTLKLPQNIKETINWGTFTGCADALNIANAAHYANNLLVVLCCDTQMALRLEREIPFFMRDELPVMYFPDWEVLPYDIFSPLAETTSERLRILYALQSLKKGVLILTSSTALQRLAPSKQVLAECFSLNMGDTLSIDSSRIGFEKLGYHNVSNVHEHGEYSVRGSILDLFPMGSKDPYRIELFDNEVESIRTFDTESQRSKDKVNQIQMFPAREFPLNKESIELFRKQFREHFPNTATSNSFYQNVSKNILPGGVENYLPLFVESTECFFDFLSDATLVLHGDVAASCEHYLGEVNTRYEQRKSDIDRPPLAPETLFLNAQEFNQWLNKFPTVATDHKPQTDESTALIDKQKPHDEQPLFNILNAAKHRTLFVAESAGHREAMLLQLNKINVRPKTIESWKAFLESSESPFITVAPIDEGIALEHISLITENQLLGAKVQQRRRRRKSANRELESIINSLAELEIGAPVVHVEHGVGRYIGLKHLVINDIETEFLTLEYANNDKLYVPVSSLELIGRFMGTSAENAPLHRLGSGQWEKARKKALNRARDVAAELLDIHARRAARSGIPLNIESDEYEKFSDTFPFEETPDQENAIEQTLHDQSLAKPMDRVICGDVGFGKTEVAMRAAFTAVENNFQVALLIPTTLLAQQHYQNFSDRFADWPVRVEVLSRFVSNKKQQQIIQDCAEGKVDILIGTHKLLQKSVKYKNLGLVIIDEEQRFGVRHKEYFKSLRSEVDLLTLTATPIPRTLNQAMSGLRDISIIATPPPNRHAIETFVSEWNDGLVQEACQREIRRGGQVFFLHNDIEGMDRIVRELQSLIPEARIQKAHGQMRESELEQIMFDFYHQRFNVLVSTTIIENGIDLPSANTILINRADKLGLSQLHQLRGRVGRSHHRAYAYMLVPPEGLMTNDAKKRIEAIQSSADLGAGFSLSTHDMEIRGAGELLGDSQSGEIQEIGFTMYTELLERSVEALKSGKQPELENIIDTGPEIDLHTSTLIPEDYLPDTHARLVLYKRISGAESNELLRDLQVEMIDRFGLLPDATKHLFACSEIKLLASEIGASKVELGQSKGRLQFSNEPNIDSAKIIELIQTQPQIFQLDGPQKLRFTKKLDTIEEKAEFILELLQFLQVKTS